MEERKEKGCTQYQFALGTFEQEYQVECHRRKNPRDKCFPLYNGKQCVGRCKKEGESTNLEECLRSLGLRECHICSEKDANLLGHPYKRGKFRLMT